MTRAFHNFIYLPGGGGNGERDVAALADGLGSSIRFDIIRYPGWQRYLEDDYSTETLIEELASEILKRVPTGPICIMGMSIGGHFGYAVALRLNELGREVAIFCAIDSFMLAAKPAAGWHMRALSEALNTLTKGGLRDFARLLRSKAWRALIRLAGDRLTGILRRARGNGKVSAIFNVDRVAEQELSMRLLVRGAVPWFAELDRNPVALMAPSILLRSLNSALHDAAWRVRCPKIAIREVPGQHETLFDPENIGRLVDAFRDATATTTAPDELGRASTDVQPAGPRELCAP